MRVKIGWNEESNDLTQEVIMGREGSANLICDNFNRYKVSLFKNQTFFSGLNQHEC